MRKLGKRLAALDLSFQLAIVTIPPFLLLGIFASVYLTGFWKNYQEFVRVREIFVLASQFAAVGESLQNETNSKMWFLLFIDQNHEQGKRDAYLKEFNATASQTDTLLAAAQARWHAIEHEALDVITRERIEEGFLRAENLRIWRRAVTSCGSEVDAAITNDPFYILMGARNVRKAPARMREQTLWDFLKERAYSDLSNYLASLIIYSSREPKDGQIARAIILQAELLRYEIVMEREDALLHYFIEEGSRPHGLDTEDVAWLRSLADRQSSTYDRIWAVATAQERLVIAKKLADTAYPRLLHAREWIAERGESSDLHQLYSPEFYEETSAMNGRGRRVREATVELREQLIDRTNERIGNTRAHLVKVTVLTIGLITVFSVLCTLFNLNIRASIKSREQAEATRREMETRLRLSQKLESVGMLAAGVAHEINSPAQFITDNMHFLKNSFEHIHGIILAHRELARLAKENSALTAAAAQAEAADSEHEGDYLIEEVPKTIEQSLHGLERIRRIVGSLKEFSHPNNAGKEPADINRAIETAIAVSQHEWKYVAEIVTELDPALPPVPCVLDEFSQAILNLLINAAHAIEEALKARGETKGLITIRTRQESGSVVIEIQDTGSGIAPENRSRIFELFFTTKEIGKGTGQGLSIAQNIIVQGHAGTINFTTEVGKGTTFNVRLPLIATGAGPLKVKMPAAQFEAAVSNH